VCSSDLVLLPVPELLLLDEPFSNMDSKSAGQMVELLAGFRRSNRTIVITTHQRELAAPIADWMVELHAGRLQSCLPGSPTTGFCREGKEQRSPEP
jgi:ABC-type multidrug transport system ATPase subunit